MKIRECLCYDDVSLEPQYSDIISRKDVDISSTLGKYKFKLPFIASPMNTISESKMALAMYKCGGLAIVHRYNSIEEQANILEDIFFEETNAIIGASIGVKDYHDRLKMLVEDYKVPIICIDIAHGHHKMMEIAIKDIKNKYGNNIHLMVGNVATLDGYEFLCSSGADSVRIGISGGSICTTKIKTGSGAPTFQSILDCFEVSLYDVPIIADGGCKNSGDIVKALAAGANFVMMGSLISGTDECPGKIIKENEQCYKEYNGMAAKISQLKNNNKHYSEEGISTKVLLKGPVKNILEDLVQNIKSGFSYSGSCNLKELKFKAKFIKQTNLGMKEGLPHILFK